MPTTVDLKSLQSLCRPLLFLTVATILASGCNPGSNSLRHTPTKPIEQVLVEKKPELMKINGVEGVFYSKLKDGSPCLKIMVKERTPEVRTRIPNRIEGYPVVVQDLDELYGKPAGDGGM